MKTFSVAVAVAVVLAFICTQESSALPVTGIVELVEPVSSDNNDNHQELPVELRERLFNIRKKRAPAECIPYCYPTRDGFHCGVTCRS
ncbi:hepcidin-like isoform X3 [Epinephelus moara]|uniref:hepcidin-like isoform X3 n=1 Tax=Epinephelus moara TaxID=300413 RepID=UPI00214E7640|nr:hepcidin-like isoform X3 [Epinephelus moara]